MKTLEQNKGELLAKRLGYLTDYLIEARGQNIPFSKYLSGKNMSLEAFLNALPEDLRFVRIDQYPLTNQDNLDVISEYTEDLNDLYIQLFIEFDDSIEILKRSAPTKIRKQVIKSTATGPWYLAPLLPLKDGVVSPGNDLSYYFSAQEISAAQKESMKTGISVADILAKKMFGEHAVAVPKELTAKEKKKQTIEKAKKEKKETKEELQAMLKAGLITKEEYKKRLKEARKEKNAKIKAVAGSKARRIFNGLNKFNPATVIIRNALRAVIGLNGFGLATKISKIFQYSKDDPKIAKAQRKIEGVYEVLGGGRGALADSVKKGKTKPPIRFSGDADGAGSGDWHNVAGAASAATASVPLATIASIVGSVAGVLTAIMNKTGDKDVNAITNNPPIPPPSEDGILDPELLTLMNNPDLLDDQATNTFWIRYRVPIIIGSSVVVATVITMIALSVADGAKKKK